MSKGSKHIELIKAWLNGAKIQYKDTGSNTWKPIYNPSWSRHTEYRIHPDQAKETNIHAEMILAWAEGAKIQSKAKCDKIWVDAESPTWNPNFEYRVKPEEIVKTYSAFQNVVYEHCTSLHNLKLTFDPDSGKLLKAEVTK